MVLATPAPATAGGTYSTQFGSATLTAGGGAGAGHVGIGATQAELPPWLRRSAMGSQGETIFDGYGATQAAGGGGVTLSANVPMRRLMPGRGAAAAAAAAAVANDSGGGGGRSVSWGTQGAGEGGRHGGAEGGSLIGFSMAAERRRRGEREMAKQRRHAVTLVRSYRAGELPDVRGVTPAALLDPLAALALRDAATASALLSALMHAALVADDNAAAADAPAAAGSRNAGAPNGSRKRSAAPERGAAVAAGSLRSKVRTALAALLPVAAANHTLAAWVLDAAAADPAAPRDPRAICRTAFEGGCLAGGILALESHVLHLQGFDSQSADTALRATSAAAAGAASSGAAAGGGAYSAPPAAKRLRTSSDGFRLPPGEGGVSGGGGVGTTGALWETLAGLHRAAGDDVASRLCLAVRRNITAACTQRVAERSVT